MSMTNADAIYEMILHRTDDQELLHLIGQLKDELESKAEEPMMSGSYVPKMAWSWLWKDCYRGTVFENMELDNETK